MTRTAVLTAKALQFNEPVLLVGPTGCGKTTICQILAEIKNTKLRILNCHMHSEGADFLGGLRPCRSSNMEEENTNGTKKLFEWADGPLVQSMQEGSFFMADEISLAEDAVLERLNSVLEPERIVILAEKGGISRDIDILATSISDEFLVSAKDGFQFLATMNPGGDFGKKELSPALRNRFTEIWCIPSDTEQDLINISSNFMEVRLLEKIELDINTIAKVLIKIILHIQTRIDKFKFSVRDVLALSNYLVENKKNSEISFPEAIVYGLETIFLDSLEMIPQESIAEIDELRKQILQYAIKQVNSLLGYNLKSTDFETKTLNEMIVTDKYFGIKPFILERVHNNLEINDFYFDAPTTKHNLFRLLSALSLKKAVLLEGPPGVGKTSIVENLAKTIGFQIVRINLSEHTDLSDLFGTDLPLEDKSLETTENHTNHQDPIKAGAFAWRDGPLLAALKSKNTWILLDELNLAPQSVLEGLNAILDHRQEVFIPELNKTFYLGEHTRLFACQNPLKQGGGRKGLPLSFLNRFTKVYLRKLNTEDLLFVISRKYSSLFDAWKDYFESFLEAYTCKLKTISVFDVLQNRDEFERSECIQNEKLIFDLPQRLVQFSEALDVAISKLEFGYKGGPFEVNLRDILRWCELLENEETGFKMIKITNESHSFETFEKVFMNFLVTLYERMKVLYYNRMRCEYDRKFINKTFGDVFNCDAEKLCMDSEDVGLYWTDSKLYLNDIVVHRTNMKTVEDSIVPKRNACALSSSNAKIIILSCQREILKNMAECMYIEKPIILSGPTDCGKTKLIDVLCTISNKFCDYDIIDDSVTGSFLQIDLNRHLEEVSLNTEFLLEEISRKIILNACDCSSDRCKLISDAVDLMQMWSSYVKINASQGSSNMTTMSEELELFRKRLFALDDVLNQMKSLKTADAHRKCIQFNHEVLSSLKKIVQNSETLNAGGHFEWVDSKIVRSLKTGSFICLDHVNLCSSAVLDRLNSVFEPNGNLLLSEKGMSETESENIVKKHKEFRAFLTLDPKNGELSRAMRNRCIEISIGNDPYTDNDLRQIIYSSGVVDSNLLEMIFKIHNRMKHVSDFTLFNVMHIVHFAFLVISNKRLGLTDSEAICTSAKEVYVNSSQTDLLGHGLDYYKNHLTQIIIDELEKDRTEATTVFELGNTIVSSNNLSTIAMVKLQCEPLRVMLQCSENTDLTKFNMSASDLFSIKLHMSLVYECSTFDDIELRSKYIISIIEATTGFPQDIIEELLLLNNLLCEIVCGHKRTSKSSLTSLPWNNKLFHRIRDYHDGANFITNAMNLSACLLCETVMENVTTEGINKLNQISILDYSKATHAKQISDSFHNVVLEHCYFVLNEVKKKVINGLNQTNLNIVDYADLILSFLWINRTLKISKEKVLKNKNINGSAVDTLALHFKWLGKNCINRIENISKSAKSEDSFRQSLYSILDNVKDLIGKPTNLLQKTFCKSILDFRPFFGENQIETEQIRNKYDALLQLIPFYGSISFDDALKKIFVMSMPESFEVKSMLSQQMPLVDLMDLDREEMLDIAYVPDLKMKSAYTTFMEKLFPSDCFEELHEKFAFIEDAKIFLDRLEQKLTEVENQKTNHSIEMLQVCSLKEYYSNRAFSVIGSHESSQVHFNIEYFKQIPTLNSSSLGLLNLVVTKKFKIFEEFWLNIIQDLDLSNLKNVIATLGRKNYKRISTFFRSLTYAHQQYVLQNIATHNRICSSLLDKEDIQADHLYDGPLLTNIVLNLFSQSNGDLRPIELGRLDMWRNTLHEASQIIWNNIHLMDVKHDKSDADLSSSILHSRKLLVDILILKDDLILSGKLSVDDCKPFWALVYVLSNKWELASNYMTNNRMMDTFMSSFLRTYFSSMLNILTGAIELSLYTYTPLIDPVEKNYLKKEYCTENGKFLTDLLNTYGSLKTVLNYRNYGREICEVLESKKCRLHDEQQKYVQKVPLRPTCNVYKKLAEEINHFFHTNCDPENFIKILTKSEKLIENAIENNTFKDAINFSTDYFAKLQEAIDTFDMWIVNSQKFLHHILAEYSLYYRDFVQPIACAISMAQYGFEQMKSSFVMLKTSLKETATSVIYNVNSKEKLATAIKCIAEFPLRNNLYMKQEANQENDAALFTLLNNVEHSQYEKFLLLKAKTLEVKNMVAITKFFEINLFSQFNNSLQMFANVWQEEEEKRKARKLEEENLYVTKYHNESLTEEEIEEQEIQQNFPNFAIGDYEQFVDNDTLNNMQKQVKTTSDQWELLTEDEIYAFVKNFTHLMEYFTTIYYYKPTKITSETEKLDVLQPFKLRFKVFRKLFSEYKTAINEYSDSILYNSFSLLIGLQQEAINEIKITKTEPQLQNFYKDSNLPEVVSCVDILNKIQPRVEKQLELYPDHAVLNDIIKIIDKIKSLPSTSPVVRFNVGFQMLRQKIAQWNEVAHKNNNFIDLETSVAEYVQRWTRLELTYWRNCLSQTYEDVQKPTYKYWFFLYEIFQEHLFNNQSTKSGPEDVKLSQKFDEDGSKTESNDILKVLKQFVESSNYADFSIRLKLLKSFEFYLHHVTCDRNYKRKAKLISMLHNLYMYYDQFAQEVDEYIKSKKAPIEKKLRELVKIESYNKDLSYFSMRNNVARVHRNLNKYLKEYASVLKEGIGKTLEVKEQSAKDFNLDNDKGINLRFEAKIKYYMLDVKNFLAPLKLKDQINSDKVKTEGSNQTLLLKSKKYFGISRNVVNKTISNANYPQLIHSLDLLLSEQIEYCDYLRKLEVDRTQEKPKQKAQAKHILNQKKKALSDLFKTLSSLGLSFKAGLREFTLNEELVAFKAPPFCIKTMFKKYKKLDQNLIYLSENLDNYYAKCCFKIVALKNIVLSPPQVDLGSINFDRIKGFSVDMFLLVQKQREIIGKTIKELYDLRNIISDIGTLTKCAIVSDNEHNDMLKFPSLREKYDVICTSNSKIRHVFEQFSLLLKCAPRESTAEFAATNGPSYVLQQTNPKLIQILEKVNCILNESSKLSSDISNLNDTEFLPFIAIKNLEERLKTVIKNVRDVREEFLLKDDNYMLIVKPISELLDELENMSILNSESYETEDNIDMNRLDKELEILMHKLLIGFQNMYKKYPEYKKKEEETIKEPDESDTYTIMDGHLKEKINDELLSDFNTLGLSNIITKLSKILLRIKYEKNAELKKSSIEKIAMIYPIVEQYNLLGDYLLFQFLGMHKISTKILCILLTVFIEVSIKGFCIPADLLQDEEGEAKKEQTGSGGFGFEDGTGENDISDKIESEDQLDDAKRPEDRDKEEKNEENCKEEKGIDMSEDFDAKMQDLDKQNNSDESEESEDDEDVDKQMGEAEEGEKLDEQIWGSDDEEKNAEDEEDLNEDDGADGSKDEGDQHNDLSNKESKSKDDANEDGLEATKDEDKTSKKEKEKDIDNMKEPEIDEDQINPYHNELEEPPEAEDLDLGDNVDIDEENCKDGDEMENNPFDIDSMKENMEPKEDETENENKEAEENEKGDEPESDSEDEETGDTKPNDSNKVEEDIEEAQEQEGNGVEEDTAPDDTQMEKPEEDEKSAENSNENENGTVDEESEQNNDDKEVREIDRNPTKEEKAESAPDEKASSDNAIESSEKENATEKPDKTDQQDTGKEKEGTGVAENDVSDEGHKGQAHEEEKKNFDNNANQNNVDDKRKPGKANEERTLGEANEKQAKQLKTIDKVQEEAKDDEQSESRNEAEEYQHVKEARKDDATTMDSATKEQSEKIQHQENDEEDNANEEENADSNMDELPNDEQMDEDIQNLENIDSERNEQKSDKPAKNEKLNEQIETTEKMEVEGEDVMTSTVTRAIETTAHLSKDMLSDMKVIDDSNAVEMLKYRKLYESQITELKSVPEAEDCNVWQSVSNKMLSSARDLCEQLRLILEPTKCTRLKGDYRTGRRINMKKIIPYIASQFRKDKIWLRRTKPSQRDYKITIAIDDSKSMHHNNSKTLTLEAISLVSQALNLLESGKLSVVSFGEAPKVIIHHTEQFDGPKLVKNLNFDQNQSKIAELLDFIRTVDAEDKTSTSNDLFENLLLILSDGRNINAEGEQKVKNTVKLARLQRIFLLYIIIDNPENKDSILDIRVPHFSSDRKSMTIKPYLDSFPFPYYIIVRDLAQLPLVLSEAMRQWFELVNSESQ